MPSRTSAWPRASPSSTPTRPPRPITCAPPTPAYKTKLNETRDRVELLTLQLRRNRAAQKASATAAALPGTSAQTRMAHLEASAAEGEAKNHAARTLLAVASAETLDERFDSLQQSDKIEHLLHEIKQRQLLTEGAEDRQALLDKPSI